MTILVALAAAAVAAAATGAATRRLLPRAPLRRRNYRGVAVATGFGIVQLGGMVAGLGFLALISEISPRVVPPGVWILPLVAAGAFAALGMFDDVQSTLASGPEHGFAGHTRALARGGLTTGGFKLLAGSLLGFAIASPFTDGFGIALIGGAVIALSANVLNSFDVRPGRASKAFLAGALPMAVVAGPMRGTVLAAVGAVLAFLPFDLRERAMGGDAGSNAFGAFLGACTLALADRTTLIVVLGVLVAVQIVAEGPTLSKAIGAVAPLRAADRWGRIPEIPSVDAIRNAPQQPGTPADVPPLEIDAQDAAAAGRRPPKMLG